MNRETIIEAMARAIGEHMCASDRAYEYDFQAAKDALSAIEAAGVRLVNFAALAEDDAAVERVARAMLADELTVRPTLAFDPAWQQECDIWLSNARAAIRAMGGE